MASKVLLPTLGSRPALSQTSGTEASTVNRLECTRREGATNPVAARARWTWRVGTRFSVTALGDSINRKGADFSWKISVAQQSRSPQFFPVAEASASNRRCFTSVFRPSSYISICPDGERYNPPVSARHVGAAAAPLDRRSHGGRHDLKNHRHGSSFDSFRRKQA